MRTKKIRGHNRRWPHVDRWIDVHKHLDLDYLRAYQRDYAKIRVRPWSGISVTNSRLPEPKGQTKARMLHGLLQIYDSWRVELDKLNECYYLKIWLFEPRFSDSQVVCAIGDQVEFYANTFFNSSEAKKLKSESYGPFKSEIENFIWEHRLDEYHIDNSEPGNQELYATVADYKHAQRTFEKLLKKPHRTTIFDTPIGEATESYSFKRGDVWLGER